MPLRPRSRRSKASICRATAEEQWPAAPWRHPAGRRHRRTAPGSPARQTHLVVNGLTSVAGISAFKGALGSLAGVRSVSVSSGEPGVFIFAVNHGTGVDLRAASPA